jgi:hypothetical protein
MIPAEKLDALEKFILSDVKPGKLKVDLIELIAAARRCAELEDALLTVLDQVDYTAGACGLTEMVGACLPMEVIKLARAALAEKD